MSNWRARDERRQRQEEESRKAAERYEAALSEHAATEHIDVLRGLPLDPVIDALLYVLNKIRDEEVQR